METMMTLFGLIRLGIHVYSGIIVASVLLSWFTLGGLGHPSVYRAQELLARATDPFLAPIRQVLMPVTTRIGLDFSPIIALFLLNSIASLLPR